MANEKRMLCGRHFSSFLFPFQQIFRAKKPIPDIRLKYALPFSFSSILRRRRRRRLWLSKDYARSLVPSLS
jgi:hypothetical protein